MSYYTEQKPNCRLWGVRNDRHKWVPGMVFGTEAQAQEWVDKQASRDGGPAEQPTVSRPRAQRSHPLGTYVTTGPGCTVYEDTTFNGGRVTIYDRS